MSFNARRIIALVVVLLGAVVGGLLATAYADSRLAPVAGVALGAVVGLAFVLVWANQSL